MYFNFGESNLLSMISNLKHMVRLNYTAIEAVEFREPLSAVSAQQLQLAKFCDLQLNRMCNIIEYLMEKHPADKKAIQSFYIKDIIEGITEQFYLAISRCKDVNIEIDIRTNEKADIMIDKSKFELVFLNILYCCIKDREEDKNRKTKIIVTVSESKGRVLFRIRDNKLPLRLGDKEDVFAMPEMTGDASRDLSAEALIYFSLHVADKAASEMEGTLRHTPLKSGNRFDINLPKEHKGVYRANSTAEYLPTYSYYNEFVADIKIKIFEKIIQELEGGEVPFL